MRKIRVRKLTASATARIEDLYPEGVESGLTIGRTFVEGEAEDLLDAAQRLRDAEDLVFFNSDAAQLEEQILKNMERARLRWAEKIERRVAHVRRCREAAARCREAAAESIRKEIA